MFRLPTSCKALFDTRRGTDKYWAIKFVTCANIATLECDRLALYVMPPPLQQQLLWVQYLSKAYHAVINGLSTLCDPKKP